MDIQELSNCLTEIIISELDEQGIAYNRMYIQKMSVQISEDFYRGPRNCFTAEPEKGESSLELIVIHHFCMQWHG